MALLVKTLVIHIAHSASPWGREESGRARESQKESRGVSNRLSTSWGNWAALDFWLVNLHFWISPFLVSVWLGVHSRRSLTLAVWPSGHCSLIRFCLFRTSAPYWAGFTPQAIDRRSTGDRTLIGSAIRSADPALVIDRLKPQIPIPQLLDWSMDDPRAGFTVAVIHCDGAGLKTSLEQSQTRLKPKNFTNILQNFAFRFWG